MTAYVRLVALQLRLSAMRAMAYRGNFVLEGVMSAIGIGLVLVPLIVLFDSREMIGDWDRTSALILVAYFIGLRAIREGLVTPSLNELANMIRAGSFDYVLLKPVDPQAMISAARYEPWKIFDLLGAIAIAAYAFVRLGHAPAPAELAAGAGMFVAGAIAMYSVWTTFAAAAFWMVRTDNLINILNTMFDTGRWPIQIFPGIWRVVFTFVIPIAVMTTFPAMALLGRLDGRTAVATVGASLGLLLVSRVVWRAALRSYTSAS